VTRLVGINHVALEVDDVDEALAFYGRFFEFSLRGRSKGAAFIDTLGFTPLLRVCRSSIGLARCML
jgi:catechol 2,3-dioxygenase-like lactoylglutathione lyase family enzyme